VGRQIDSFLTTALRLARSPIFGYPVAIVAVIATSWVVGDLEAVTQINDASILYLLVIVGAAITYGIGPAMLAAVFSLAMFDWFLDPVGTLIPESPAEFLTLCLFLFVGVVTSQLAAGQRKRADEAREREQEALALYSLNSLLVSTNDASDFLAATLRVFKSQLQIEGLALLAPDESGRLTQRAEAGELRTESDTERQLVHDTLFNGQHQTQFTRQRTRLPSGAESAWSELSPDDVLSDRLDSVYAVVRSNGKSIGVVRICRATAAANLAVPQRRFLAAVAQQVGISLERAQLQEKAADAAALRRAEEVKNAVLNSVTHDLRTPLAMIKASAGNLRTGQISWSDEEKDAFAQSIEKNADRLDGIVGNLLELSRIDAGMIRPERQYYPLAAIVDDVVNRLNPLLGGHAVTVDVSDDLPPVPVDYVAIDRVLSNLLENAVRHTAAATAIVISATTDDDEVIASVADNGAGIAASVLPHLFERFQRGRAARPDSRSGVGIGLAVVKGLVEAHGGRCWVESREGRGSTFFFSLPLTASVQASPAP